MFIEAYSLSIGAILPPADGFLTAWGTGSSQPVVSQLNFLTNEVVFKDVGPWRGRESSYRDPPTRRSRSG